jgi:hypothetical protein
LKQENEELKNKLEDALEVKEKFGIKIKQLFRRVRPKSRQLKT